MEKQNLEKIYYVVMTLLVIAGWLWFQYPSSKDQIDDYIYYELIDYDLNEYEKGDLFILLDNEMKIQEYFKLAWMEGNNRIGIVMGNDSTHLLRNKYPSDYIIEILSENNSYNDSLIIKQTNEITKLLEKAGKTGVKIYREYETSKMVFFRTVIFSPWGFLVSIILAFFLIWAGRSISIYFEVIFSINKKWIEIIGLILICFFFNPFVFLNWIWNFLFCLVSVIVAYYMVQRKIKQLNKDNAPIQEIAFSLIIRIMLVQSTVQLVIFLLFSTIPLRYFGYSSFLIDNSYHKIGSKGIIFIFTAFAIGNFLNNLRKYLKELAIKDQQLSITQLKAQQSKAELDALQSKVNPHFLYNSLNSIAGLAQEDPAKTEEMAIALSHFYKQSTNRQGEHWNTIEEALELLQTYLGIEKIRFGDRLQFDIQCPESLKEEKIPRFLIQPLVENAIKYGYQASTNSITIRLELEKIDNQLLIRLFDQGPPFPDNLKKLELLYPDRYELAFINLPEKQVVITLGM